MAMAQKIVSLLLVFILVDVSGQDLQPLLKQLEDESGIRERVFILHELAAATWDYDHKRAYQFAQQAFKLADETEFIHGKEISLRDLGIYHDLCGDLQGALLKFKESLIFNTEGESRGLTFILIANVFTELAIYDSASNYYQNGRQLLQSNGDSQNDEFYYRSMGGFSLDLMNTTEAKQYLHSSVGISKKLTDSVSLAKNYMLLEEAHLQVNNFDSAKYYMEAASGIIHSLNSNHLMTLRLIGEAKFFEEKSMYPQSIRVYEEANKKIQDHGYLRYKGKVLSGIGRVYERMGEYEMALEKYFQALEILEEAGNRYEAGRVYAQSAWAYYNQRNFEKVIEVTDKALEIFKTIGHPPRISYVYNLKGLMAFRNNEIEKSLAYYDSALTIRRSLDNQLYYYHTLNNLAQVYTQTGEHEKALKFLKQAAEGEYMLLDYFNLATTYNNMARLYFKMNDLLAVKEYLTLAESISKKYKHSTQLARTYKMFGEYYKQVRQFEKAALYYELYSGLNDSIYDKNLQDRVDRLHAVYDIEIKEKEIESLNQEKALAEKEASNQRLTIRNQRYFIAFTASSILLLLLLSFALFRYYKEKDKANKFLEKLNREILEQKEELQAQSEELTESHSSLSILTEKLQIANEKVQETNAELENLVETRTQELRKAYIELDTFFYRASHDFRRPITTFLGLAEVAKMTIKDKAALELFVNVRDTARSLDRMIIKLNAVSDIGSHQLVFKEVFLKEMIHDVLEVFKDKIKEYNIRILEKIEANKQVLSYPALVQVIIENLIENAIDFRNSKDPEIEITTHIDNAVVLLVIRDNGQGVEEEHISKIFDMYFRGNVNSRGNGLGLYVVKKAVNKIGGHINFESEKYKGTTVTITFPLHSTGDLNT